MPTHIQSLAPTSYGQRQSVHVKFSDNVQGSHDIVSVNVPEITKLPVLAKQDDFDIEMYCLWQFVASDVCVCITVS